MKKKKKPEKNVKISRTKEIVIVKRRGHTEPYNEKKVYGSSYFACRNAHLSEIESEIISEKVAKSVTKKVKELETVSSDDIFKLIIEELMYYNEDAAFLFETHRDIS